MSWTRKDFIDCADWFIEFFKEIDNMPEADGIVLRSMHHRFVETMKSKYDNFDEVKWSEYIANAVGPI